VTTAKLEIKVGAISFMGEGAENWLAHQLDKVLTKIPELVAVHVRNGDDADPESERTDKSNDGTHSGGKKTQVLAAFLKERKATNNQARKFLATALWLQDVKSMKRVGTADVTKSLNDHNQGKLTNAAQCLANNVKTGKIVKDGKQFYVTDHGRGELGK